MNQLYKLLLFITAISSCKKDITTNTIVSNSMTIKSSSTYTVVVEQNVKYGEGLSHQSYNSTTYSTMDLKLDVYKPANNTKKKPAILLIHGGGFSGGDKTDVNIVNLANYFASRGWVAFSINYRLLSNKGTVPTEWIQYAQNSVATADQGQFLAMYPAHRDAKAALRWLIANANQYNIDTNYITVGGGSAGAIIATTLGITNTIDFTNEISMTNDPTLVKTNLNSNNYSIKTILDFWGSGVAVTANNNIYGYNRFDFTDPPIMIAHGTNDQTVLYSEAILLKNIYTSTGASYKLYTLENRGHGPWDATINGKKLEELSFDFIVEKQKIVVE
ncbi:MAG TPA: alpha/beta hydrolase [Sediminibacterium sp.]|uniref:alpha/beta hydrolase n=1 Tax=Sediminibacterium sp. TaxID=1917865 RepID=UPI0026C91135|nr:alpha/beta hydrolase [Sediminibacterium sp.]HLD53449.1 alpha/beta hydrolase [Sediminibacterium sp.]